MSHRYARNFCGLFLFEAKSRRWLRTTGERVATLPRIFAFNFIPHAQCDLDELAQSRRRLLPLTRLHSDRAALCEFVSVAQEVEHRLPQAIDFNGPNQLLILQHRNA